MAGGLKEDGVTQKTDRGVPLKDQILGVPA